MTEFSWRNLTFDEEADTHLLDYFCKRGTSEKDPTKHGKLALFGLLLKYMVASGALVIEIIEEGVPILSRGNVQPTSGRVQHRALQGTDNNLRVASNESSQTQTQLQQAHLQQTPSQLAHANARSAKMAYEKATRIVQERTQGAAQEVKRIKQEATADSRKAKKAERYRATMEKLGKLPPCPKLCRAGNARGFPARKRSRVSPTRTSTTWSTCGQQGRGQPNLHLRQDLLQKTRAGEPRARGTAPRATAATRRLGSCGTQEMGLSGSSSSNSLEGNSSSSSATSTTGGQSRS
jgi:hypothetical protein